MTKYAAILEYDGSEFHGWQSQVGVVTVQDTLESALSSFAHSKIKTITAGRTDTGVHALNQVVHFSSDANRPISGWINGVNAKLPKDIRIKNVSIVDDSFDARFSAVSRTYHYYLLLQPHNSVHLYRYVGWYHSNLDLELMQDAAQLLLGKHDFSSFRASSCQANSPIRDMHELKIDRVGNMLRFSLTANAFLHHMVRNIVGALVYVGNGKINYSDFERIFKQANRNFAPPTFMPNGLYLADVEYPQFIENNFNPDVWLFNH